MNIDGLLILEIFASVGAVEIPMEANSGSRRSSLYVDPPEMSSFSESIKYDPVGQCIYCGSVDNLSDEHTLASGLGGRHVLPKSSCEDCRKVIQQPEQYVQRTLLHNARSFYGIRSHRKRPSLATTIQVQKKSGEVIEITGDPREIPFLIVLPIFPNPTLLTDDKPPPSEVNGQTWSPKPKGYREFLEKHDAVKILSKEIRPSLLARVIAKTAHAHARALLGPGAYKPLLNDLILGKNDFANWNQLVGGEIRSDTSDWRLLEPTPDHLNTFVVFDWFRKLDGKCFYVAAVRLFANLGAPTYFAVLGEPIPQRAPWRIKPEVARRLGGRHTPFVPRVSTLQRTPD